MPTDDLATYSGMLQRLATDIDALGSLELVATGYGATTLRSASGIAIRIPRTERHAVRQQAQTSLLRRLSPMLPVAIPVPLWAIQMSHPLAFGATGYAWLPGETLSPQTMCSAIAEHIGGFLATLHTIDENMIHTFAGTLPDRAAVDVDRERVMAVALPWLRDMAPAPVIEKLEQWWDRYRAARAVATYSPRLVHGDFWFGNVPVDPEHQKLTAVIDWENAAVDGPAQDLATLRHAGDTFSEQVLRAYRAHGGAVDNEVLERTQWHWEFREFTGIALALEIGDEIEARDAARKLRQGVLRELFEVGS